MLLTKAQQFTLDAVGRLGCVRRRQLAALLDARFPTGGKGHSGQRVDAILGQLRFGNANLRLEGDLVLAPHGTADPLFLEAVDVMLELAGGALLEYAARQPPPVLLRFSTQSTRIHLFAVAAAEAVPPGAVRSPSERIVYLTSTGGLPAVPQLPNKQFYAVRQADGSHRFFAQEGQNNNK